MASGNPSERARPVGTAASPPQRTWGGLFGSAGFTLLEVVLSMALTGVGVLGLAGLLRVMGNVEAEDTWATRALFCAQEGLEELRYNVSVGGCTAGEGNETLSDGAYEGMWRMWAVEPASMLDGLWTVSVECGYDAKGAKQSVRLESLVFREG